MRSFIFSTCFLLAFFSCMDVFSQFTLSAEFRPRFEYRKGYKQLPDENSQPAFFVNQRSRLNLSYSVAKLKTKISLQDVRIWGDEVFKTDVPGFNLYEAWAEIPICDSLFLKAGRQEFVYDNERLLSKNNWNQLGATHNAALISFRKTGIRIDFATAFNQSEEKYFGTDYSDINTNYKSLNFLWISKDINDFMKISALGIMDGYQKENTENTTYLRGTFGGIFEVERAKDYSITLRGFYQTGQLQTGQEVSAYYANADFSYTLKKKYTVIAGFEYISGKDAKDTANKRNNTFSTLYGTAHKFNGNMDFFTNMPKDTKNAGLINPYFDIIVKLGERSKLRADFHYFFLQNNFLINDEPIKKALGAEADLSYSYDISKDVNLLAGISVMNPTPQMEIFSGGNSGYYGTWGFVMLTVKPSIFLEGKK